MIRNIIQNLSEFETLKRGSRKRTTMCKIWFDAVTAFCTEQKLAGYDDD